LASDFGEVRGFRKTLALVREMAEAAVREDVSRSIPLLFRAPELAPLFAPGGRYAERESLDELIQSMTTGQLENTTRAQDKASIVLAFAAFDTMVTDLLRIVALADSAAFREWVNGKKVQFGDIAEKGQIKVLEELVDREIAQLDRETVLKRVRTILGVLRVGPEDLRNPETGYSFSEEMLSSIDDSRNDLVHGRAAQVDLANVDGMIAFMEGTIGILWGGVVLKYNLTSELVDAWNAGTRVVS